MVNNTIPLLTLCRAAERRPPTTVNLDIVHQLPGRLRLRTTSPKRDIREIVRCRCHLAEIYGVISVEANRSTGSFLLKYDPTVLPPDEIANAFGLRGIILSDATAVAAPALRQDAMKSRLARLLLEVLTERILVAMLGAAI